MRTYDRLQKIVSIVEKNGKNGTAPEEIRDYLEEGLHLRRVRAGGLVYPGATSLTYICYIIRGSYFTYRFSKNGKMNLLSKENAPTWGCLDKVFDTEHANFVEARALSVCDVLDIDADYFKMSLKNTPELAIHFIKLQQTLISQMSLRSDYLIFSNAREHFLFYVLQYWDTVHAGEGTCRIEMKNDYIAFELGISVRTLYRVQRQLKEEGLIAVEKRDCVVNQEQIERIRSYFEGFQSNI